MEKWKKLPWVLILLLVSLKKACSRTLPNFWVPSQNDVLCQFRTTSRFFLFTLCLWHICLSRMCGVDVINLLALMGEEDFFRKVARFPTSWGDSHFFPSKKHIFLLKFCSIWHAKPIFYERCFIFLLICCIFLPFDTIFLPKIQLKCALVPPRIPNYG